VTDAVGGNSTTAVWYSGLVDTTPECADTEGTNANNNVVVNATPAKALRIMDCYQFSKLGFEFSLSIGACVYLGL
jgi:hypothetical protein